MAVKKCQNLNFQNQFSMWKNIWILLIFFHLKITKKENIFSSTLASFWNVFIKFHPIFRWETKFSPAWPGSSGTAQPLEAAATKEISSNRLWHLVGSLHRGLHGGSHVPANYAKPETAFEQIEISPAFEAAVANCGRQQSGMLFIKAVWHNSVLHIHDYSWISVSEAKGHTL